MFPCCNVYYLSALSRFGPGVCGLSALGPIALPSPGLPLAPLDSPMTPMCLPVPGSQATFQANGECRYISHATAGLLTESVGVCLLQLLSCFSLVRNSGGRFFLQGMVFGEVDAG